ncbi:hypothetical protein CAOG_03902 [Capsaspora owczarzaki ATCC 30864]|uniref:Tetratricopeptide SHNi-TPR domain-containing protein n=1 Tax=Capsaspora owczarzaki (strain ATCC 30864) TaxID=595528 RepID=A0A0D2X2S2_CAPO3|nr:hypothetical protein CAOG_03902 [Capsaspora owczarzaki ATCC 30864]KJE93054.1 hypothetical protein CAOG_003902 [Capsaspora owczarzaki ATCC 30864]|eukprot:XP_004363630.1 hypothetical protein CAOG_03902 [Capsaspora owczarzaki ATCC 30864]
MSNESSSAADGSTITPVNVKSAASIEPTTAAGSNSSSSNSVDGGAGVSRQNGDSSSLGAASSSSSSSSSSSVAAASGSSSSQVDLDAQMAAEMADQHATPQELIAERMQQGRRQMLCEEYLLAVDCFQEAVETSVVLYGELADECGEPFFQYGSALLAAARAESQVFERPDNASASKNESDDDSDDDNDEDDDDAEAAAASSKGKGKAANQDQENDDDGNEQGQDDENAPADDEDVDNLQLAWENLECARVIFARQSSLKARLALASVHARLGEHSVESEQFDQAFTDFKECLHIRESILPAHDRSIAELLFTMAIAYQLGRHYNESVDSLQRAMTVMNMRLRYLRSGEALRDATAPTLSAANEASKIMSPLPATQAEIDQEINDLTELIPDIRSKIAEINEEGEAFRAGQFEMIKHQLGATSSSSSAPAPVSAAGAAVAEKRNLAASLGFGTAEDVAASLSLAGSSSSSAAAAAAAVVNTLQVRRKVAPTAVSSANVASGSSSSSAPVATQKRQNEDDEGAEDAGNKKARLDA